MTLFSKFTKFKVALSGISHALKTEASMKAHLFFTIIVLSLMVFLDLSALEISLILLCIGMVISCELFNSAIERTVDLISSEHDNMIMHIKDMAAGAVLISVIISMIAGFIIIVPKCLILMKLWKETL